MFFTRILTAALEGLKASIARFRLLQPILVAATDDGYTLLAGRRRLAACRLLGMDEIIAHVVPIDSEQAIEIQIDENGARKALTPMEAVRIAQRLRPLVQAEVEKRRTEGANSRREPCKTREIVARRVGLSHESLKQAEYVLVHQMRLREQLDHALQAGDAEPAVQELVAKLEALVTRMDLPDPKQRLAISRAYKTARALIEGQADAGKTARADAGPKHVVRLPADVTARDGRLIRGEVILELPEDKDAPGEPSNAVIVCALQAAISALMRGDLE